jgi:V-type H+-transporting ATPase subunit C
MPSDQSTWLVAVPQDGDSEGLHQELEIKFQQQLKTFHRSTLAQLNMPTFKVLSPY